MTCRSQDWLEANVPGLKEAREERERRARRERQLYLQGKRNRKPIGWALAYGQDGAEGAEVELSQDGCA